MNNRFIHSNFWVNKRVFLTGHTGFKGSWLSLWLSQMGAKVTGYSLLPNTSPSMFSSVNIEGHINRSIIGDIRDVPSLNKALHDAKPDIIFHMAAQPLVRYSYSHPIETFSTNVMGTANVLEFARYSDTVKAIVVVTTDKCYENQERDLGYSEQDPLGGHDPYSSSKACTELVAAAYQRSYFAPNCIPFKGITIATARAGNVIGGGDWSADRLIPDAISAFNNGAPLMIRNPGSTRPWQHVLEPLSGYLLLAEKIYTDGQKFAGGWNFGPKESDAESVENVINRVIAQWGLPASWKQDGSPQPHEAHFLKLNCDKANQQLGWYPRWELSTAISKTINWYRSQREIVDMSSFSISQINEYLNTKPNTP